MGEGFIIKIADVKIGIKPRDERIEKFCKKYICDGEPDFIIEVSDSNIEEENERAISYFGRGDTPRLELEKLFIYREIAENMPKYDTFLIHATAVSVDGEAYLFAGPSGTGKTTHARLWKKALGDRLRVINDDKPLIKTNEDGITVYGSPWSGKERWSNNISAPLKTIICLHQSKENSIEEINGALAWENLMNQVYRSRKFSNLKKTLGFIDRIISRVPIYSMECTKEVDAVKIAYETVSGSTL